MQADSVQNAAPGDAFDAQRVFVGRLPQVWVLLLDLAANHQLDHALERQVLDLVGPHVRAVSQDRDAVADLGHLRVAMRDVDEGDVVHQLELADEGEELPSRVLLEHVRGLVENDHLRVSGQSACDLDHLLLGDAQPRDQNVGVQIDVELSQVLVSSGEKLLLVDDAGRKAWLVAEKHVSRDRQVLRQVQFLVDELQAIIERVLRLGDGHRLAVDEDLSVVASVRAGEHLDERAFPRAVLAQENVDFAGT